MSFWKYVTRFSCVNLGYVSTHFWWFELIYGQVNDQPRFGWVMFTWDNFDTPELNQEKDKSFYTGRVMIISWSRNFLFFLAQHRKQIQKRGNGRRQSWCRHIHGSNWKQPSFRIHCYSCFHLFLWQVGEQRTCDVRGNQALETNKKG